MLGCVDDAGCVVASPCRDIKGPADPLACGLGDLARQILQGGQHARPEAGAEHRAEQRDTNGATEFTGGVVERRGNPLLVGGERLGDLGGGWSHRETQPETEPQQAGEHRDVTALNRGPEGERNEPEREHADTDSDREPTAEASRHAGRHR